MMCLITCVNHHTPAQCLLLSLRRSVEYCRYKNLYDRMIIVIAIPLIMHSISKRFYLPGRLRQFSKTGLCKKENPYAIINIIDHDLQMTQRTMSLEGLENPPKFRRFAFIKATMSDNLDMRI